jgi:hypothetical protein
MPYEAHAFWVDVQWGAQKSRDDYAALLDAANASET